MMSRYTRRPPDEGEQVRVRVARVNNKAGDAAPRIVPTEMAAVGLPAADAVPPTVRMAKVVKVVVDAGLRIARTVTAAVGVAAPAGHAAIRIV